MTTFVVLVVAYTLSQFYRSFLAILTADFHRDLGLSAPDLGLISAVWLGAFALGQFPIGWALDRFGPRRTLAGFMLFAVAGAAWLPAARGFADVTGAMALIGLGCAPILMASYYVFARGYPPDRFVVLASAIVGFGALGDLIGAAPLALATERFGWRPTLAVAAGVTAASCVLVALLVRDPPPAEKGSGRDTLWSGLVEVLRIRALWLMLPLVFVSYAVLIATRSLWISPYLGEVHGYDRLARGNAASLLAITMVLGAFSYGPLARLTRDPKRTVLAGCAVAGTAFLTLGLAGAASAKLAVGVFAVIGASGMTYALLMAHARTLFPGRLMGRGVTFLNFAFMGGSGAVQALSGIFVAHMQADGLAPSLLYGRLFVSFGLVLLGAAVLYAFTPAPSGPGTPA